MALEYFPCYNSYEEKTAKLNDDELGRLFRALMHYSGTGEKVELDGREELAFDFIVADIDRAKEQYDKKCKKNTANGTRGGRPVKPNGLEENPNNPTVSEKPNGLEENPNNPTVILETQKSQNKNKTKSKYKNNTYPPLSPQGETGQEGETVEIPENIRPIVTKWLEYKKSRRFTYKPASLRALVEKTKACAREYGVAAVDDVVSASIANGYQGVVWDRLRKPTKPPNLRALECSTRKYSKAEIDKMGIELLED